MDHPSEEWIDWNLMDVKNGYNLDIHIRFEGLKKRDETDHEKCLWWELYRTRIFKDESFRPHDSNSFPFYVSSFPKKAYLSHDYNTRSRWKPFEGAKENCEDLIPRNSKNNYELDDGFFKNKIFQGRVPVVLQVDPNWNVEKIISLIRKQSAKVYQTVKGEKEELEKKGLNFSERKLNPKPISTHKKNLKALGHYRIGECMNLGWKYERFKKIYGLDTYKTEKIYRENLLTYKQDLAVMKGERFANAKSLGKHYLII